jgi:uncharacterized lipoprotein YajG
MRSAKTKLTVTLALSMALLTGCSSTATNIGLQKGTTAMTETNDKALLDLSRQK